MHCFWFNLRPFWSPKICSLTDSCTDHLHGRIEPASSALMTHTFGLYEMPVTRSLLSIGWPFLRPLIWLAAYGAGPPCSMKQWKRTFPHFLVLLLFSFSIRLYFAFMVEEKYKHCSLHFHLYPLSLPWIYELRVDNILEHEVIFSYIDFHGI